MRAVTIDWEAKAMTKRRRITSRARGFLRSTRAVSALEYAILVGVIVVGVAGALSTFGTQIDTTLKGMFAKAFATASPPAAP